MNGVLPASHPMVGGLTNDSDLIRAYRGQTPRRHPIWMMRQAGRSLPEYRELRAGTAMLDSCLHPPTAAEITLQPVRRHQVDAAIFFSDIVVPLRLAGIKVEIVSGVGPVMEHPVRTAADLAALPELELSALAPITEAVDMTVQQLGATPLIGFAGAPFTLASYLIEGSPARDLPQTLALASSDPGLWHDVLAWVSRTTTTFLRAQGLAGASALQLFDSWVGALSPTQYADLVAEHSASVFAGVADLGLPRVHFGTRTAPLLTAMHQVGADVVGVASDIRLADAIDVLGGQVPVQGNIDPTLLAGDEQILADHVRDVVNQGLTAPGHVVNLGHGVPPTTDPEVLTRMVALVHSLA